MRLISPRMYSLVIMVSFDGQTGTTLGVGERVTVRRSGSPVLLARLQHDRFFSRMRAKLHWGDLSEREHR